MGTAEPLTGSDVSAGPHCRNGRANFFLAQTIQPSSRAFATAA